MHRLAVLALDRVIAFDLAIPCQVFGTARLSDGSPAYELTVCSPERSGRVEATDGTQPQFTLRFSAGWERLAKADTIVVPGLTDIDLLPPPRVVRALAAAVERGTRVASICTGAFVLAAAGVLDGRRATTHWGAADELARRYPQIDVHPDVLFVDNDGLVLTSAGLAAGLDLCLYMVGQDHGATVAATLARHMVAPMVRQGGQAQFIEHRPPEPTNARDGPGLQATLDWMSANLHEPLTLAQIARQAMVSVRSLNRHFREEVGTSPRQWLLQARVERAKELLEQTNLSVERIAQEVGFGSSVTLRQQFSRRVGVSPYRYRAAFQPQPIRAGPTSTTAS